MASFASGVNVDVAPPLGMEEVEDEGRKALDASDDFENEMSNDRKRLQVEKDDILLHLIFIVYFEYVLVM